MPIYVSKSFWEYVILWYEIILNWLHKAQSTNMLCYLPSDIPLERTARVASPENNKKATSSYYFFQPLFRLPQLWNMFKDLNGRYQILISSLNYDLKKWLFSNLMNILYSWTQSKGHLPWDQLESNNLFLFFTLCSQPLFWVPQLWNMF